MRDDAAGVDVGGTFTDVVLVRPGGRPVAVKVPTTPDDQGVGVVAGLHAAAGGGAGGGDSGHPPLVAHGTTTATNAVLERNVARTVLVTTAGFRDVLHIGRQQRPALYDLAIVRPVPLVASEQVVEVAERTAADGRVVTPLTDGEVERVVAEVRDLAPESVAVCLLFAYARPAHEERLAAALGAALHVPVTRSSELSPEFREYERTSTVVLNAAVAPVMGRYLGGLRDRLAPSTVTVMTSGGGTAGVDAAARRPVLTLLSGPAAGVVAAGQAAASAGFGDAVAFDMGGTSTDVCLIRDGRPDLSAEATIAGLPFRTPSVAIHTVGAGGGSIAAVDAGGALQVGPRSAGARPGPACYGLGGREPTVTDAHCALGHLDAGRTLGGGLRLDREAAEAALATLPDAAGGADGVLTVVRATMARALRRVTTERGIDPAGLALVAYGGAGPLSATSLARELGCAAVVLPPVPGVLSALGLLLAPPRVEVGRTVLGESDPEPVWAELEEAARAEMAAQGAGEPVTVSRLADLRYAGQSHELRVPVAGLGGVEAALAAAHAEAYGYAMPGEPVEIVTLRVVAEGLPALPAPPPSWDLGPAAPPRSRVVGAGPDAEEVPVIARASVAEGDRVEGPAVVEQPDSTTLLGPGDVAVRDRAGNLVVRLA